MGGLHHWPRPWAVAHQGALSLCGMAGRSVPWNIRVDDMCQQQPRACRALGSVVFGLARSMAPACHLGAAGACLFIESRGSGPALLRMLRWSTDSSRARGRGSGTQCVKIGLCCRQRCAVVPISGCRRESLTAALGGVFLSHRRWHLPALILRRRLVCCRTPRRERASCLVSPRRSCAKVAVARLRSAPDVVVHPPRTCVGLVRLVQRLSAPVWAVGFA